VHASLTENVEAMVRLINERVWSTHKGGCDGVEPLNATERGDIIGLDLAYIKVSDLMAPGLVLTVGRQEIQFGEGLVVGSAYSTDYPAVVPGSPFAGDLGLQKAFDAIRVDYTAAGMPLDITAFVATISEDGTNNDDDRLYGLNVGFDAADVARVEGYYVRYENLDDGSTAEGDVTTVGIRATGDVAGFGLKGEIAKQMGECDDLDNEGWALLLGGSYNLPTEMDANVHANFNLYSGDKDGSSDGDNSEWTTLFPSNVANRIGAINYVLATMNNQLTNAQVINIGGGIRPVEKIGLSLDWFNVKLREDASWAGTEDEIGNEIDAAIVYDYTEDLSFGLQYGILLAGDALDTIYDDDPWQLIASMKLAF